MRGGVVWHAVCYSTVDCCTIASHHICRRLYEAYNDLHSLAQDFEKPFDAPAILCGPSLTQARVCESC